MAQSLSDETQVEFKQAFDSFDKKKTGNLEKKDLGSLMNHLRFYPKESELEEIFAAFNEEITFPDFLEIMATRMYDHNTEQELLQAFKLYDEKETGFVNASDIKLALANVDPSLNKNDLDVMIRGLIDVDGTIDYTKLIREFLFR